MIRDIPSKHKQKDVFKPAIKTVVNGPITAKSQQQGRLTTCMNNFGIIILGSEQVFACWIEYH